MYILINTKTKETHLIKDQKELATRVKVHPLTISRQLATKNWWEKGIYVVSRPTDNQLKSNKGRNTFKS